MEDTFNKLYQSEQQEGTLFNYFSAIAIFISCLGLLGLAAYTAQVRTKEIGLRKVLGASVSNIIRLLAKDFIRLVLIAIVIAIPVAWYFMNLWLAGFRLPDSGKGRHFRVCGIVSYCHRFCDHQHPIDQGSDRQSGKKSQRKLM